jgi:Domain of unknown function (DUF5658)
MRRGGYNVRTLPSKRDQKNLVFIAAAVAARRPVSLPERRRTERRTRVLRALLHGSVHPRRRGPRRAGEHAFGTVDWHHPQWLATAMLIVMLCTADAFLTLVLLERGAYEINPVMRVLLLGSGLAFAVVKIGLTAAGVVLLTLLARIRAFGRISVGALLYGVLAAYALLVAYELRLLG